MLYRPLLQVVLEFPSVFWNDAVDYFGAAGEPTGVWREGSGIEQGS